MEDLAAIMKGENATSGKKGTSYFESLSILRRQSIALGSWAIFEIPSSNTKVRLVHIFKPPTTTGIEKC